jgi:2-keto-4-pentenoate hydratase
MLMSTQANRYAQLLLDARAHARTLPCLSKDGISLADAYEIAHRILDVRIAEGETLAGRKIGYTNPKLWPQGEGEQAITSPIWAPMYDTTVRYAEHNHGVQSLLGAVQPRIEPEIVFMLGQTPPADASVEDMAECISWMAHGFEIVGCPFPDWKFAVADVVAAFGLHGTLIVGEPHMLSAATRQHLATILPEASVSMSRSEGGEFFLQSAGFGSDVMGSPVHALWHLHQVLKSQPQFPPLGAGELIATGALTAACPVKPGQTWTTAFSGVSLPGLTVSFV